MKKRNIVIMLVVGITSLCTTAPIMAVTESCTHGKKTFNDKKIIRGIIGLIRIFQVITLVELEMHFRIG